jgi:acetyl esterase
VNRAPDTGTSRTRRPREWLKTMAVSSFARQSVAGHAERAAAIALVRLPPRALRRIVGPPIRSPEGFRLDLQSQALLWMVRVRGTEIYGANVDRSRRSMDRASRILEPRAVAPLRVFDWTLPGGVGPRPARVYVPVALPPRLGPALVWFHGGGFVLGSIESHDGVCRALASRSGVMVISVGYRLAPEHPFPAGLDDAVAATQWVLDEGRSIGVDPGAVAVGGDSAGGNLAAGVAQALRGATRRPAFQFLVYPATDATRSQASHRHFADGFLLTEDNIVWFLDQYVPQGRFITDARVSPLLACDFSGLAPALMMVAGFDPLRDEGRLYAERMRDAGVDVETVCSDGSIHGFLNTAGALDESARLLALGADRLRFRLGSIASAPGS